MSLFTCFEYLSHLKQYYPHLAQEFDHYQQWLQSIEQEDKPQNLSLVIHSLKEQFPDIAAKSSWSPSLWLPLREYDFTQKVKKLIDELSECADLARQLYPNEIPAFSLPTIKAPALCNQYFYEKYLDLENEIAPFKNDFNAEQIYQYWSTFSATTLSLEQDLLSETTSPLFRYQAKQYLKLRHGIENQLGLAYLYHKNKKSVINASADWRKGSNKSTGYGLIMAMAHPELSPHNNQVKQYKLDYIIEQIENHRKNKSKDQALIKHNRITPLIISDLESRTTHLIKIAKEHPNQHLKIKMYSRGFQEKYSYLRLEEIDATFKIYFCDPDYGMFEFSQEQEFIFFYQMLYAKEELLKDTSWNRYQVSVMNYAPEQQAEKTFAGKIRSFLYGLKYNRSPIDVIKEVVLFNITLFLSLLAAFTTANLLAIIYEPLSLFLVGMLAHSGFSLIVGAAFIFGSAGILAVPDLLHAVYLTASDKIKSTLGFHQHYETVLHKNFTESGIIDPEFYSSHQHLLKQLPQGEDLNEEQTLEKSPQDVVHSHDFDARNGIGHELEETQAHTIMI